MFLLGGNLDVEHVDTGEFLEQNRLALHDRLGGKRPDVAETQDCRSVGHDPDQILPRRQRVGIMGKSTTIASQAAATPGE